MVHHDCLCPHTRAKSSPFSLSLSDTSVMDHGDSRPLASERNLFALLDRARSKTQDTSQQSFVFSNFGFYFLRTGHHSNPKFKE